MVKAPVLVLDCECAAGVESVQSLGRYGAEVHAASREREALGFTSKYCRKRLLQPTDPSEFGVWLLALDSENNYTLLVPSTEISLSALEASMLSESIRSKAVLSSREAIATALDKEQVWQLASQLEIPVPRSVLQNGITAQAPFAFPVVVKPVQSKRIEKGIVRDFRVSIIRNQKDWDDFAEQNTGTFQVQEYFTGRGIGIELLFAQGEPVWHFAHERLHEYPLTGGGSSYRRSIAPPPVLLDDSIRLLKALHWHGVAMIEWKINDRGECSLMEINPRLWGSLALAIDAGVNFPVGLLNIAQKTALAPQPKFRIGYNTRNIARDFNWQSANWRADHSNPLLFTKPRIPALLELLRPLIGIESWDHFDWRDLAVTRRILGDTFLEKGRSLATKLWRKKEAFAYRHGKQDRKIRKIQAAGTPQSLIFLCYGNICRSPLAEHIAQAQMPDLHITSAGFYRTSGRLSPEKMLDAAQSLGLNIDLSTHRSSRINETQIRQSDVIVIMDWRNYDLLKREFPAALNKTLFLGLFADPPKLEIDDPLDLPAGQVAQVTREIESAVANLLKRLWPTRTRTAQNEATASSR